MGFLDYLAGQSEMMKFRASTRFVFVTRRLAGRIVETVLEGCHAKSNLL